MMAADLFIYIDDLRPTGPSRRECWAAAHQVGCRLTWFGLQDAARKRRKASQKPGAWADGEEVCVLVSQEKWDKTRRWILQIPDQLLFHTPQMKIIINLHRAFLPSRFKFESNRFVLK